MLIYHTSTMEFTYSCYSDGLHMIHEIDDDEMGFWSIVEYVIPRDSLTKLFSIISEKEFLELCRKDGYTGMLDFLDSNSIEYYKKDS